MFLLYIIIIKYIDATLYIIKYIDATLMYI